MGLLNSSLVISRSLPMIKSKVLSIAAALGMGFVMGVGMVVPSATWAQTVTMNEEMLDRCDEEGISPEACACWFLEIAENEELYELSEADIDELAPYYQEELAICMEIND
jgi:hypothetical protein